MRSVKARQTITCDGCIQDINYGTQCLSCGKDFCFDCRKNNLISFDAGVHHQGFGDGYFCNSCFPYNIKEELKPLLAAYKNVLALRDESKVFYEQFKIRQQFADAAVERLYRTVIEGQ